VITLVGLIHQLPCTVEESVGLAYPVGRLRKPATRLVGEEVHCIIITIIFIIVSSSSSSSSGGGGGDART
jgi:hypothetical protein